MSSLGLNIGKFRQTSIELWPLIYIKISFPGSILSIYFTNFLQFLYRSSARNGLGLKMD